MPKHVEILLITNKSLFVASSWFLLYLLIKDARSFEHKVYLLTFPRITSSSDCPLVFTLQLKYAKLFTSSVSCSILLCYN